MNYSTTEQDVRDFFSPCGVIKEITFPTYSDSGRSKGYCGILFASPKAVKAVEMNGCELHGRWLSVQEGKMYLRKWEEDERNRKGGKESGWDNGEEGEKGRRRNPWLENIVKRLRRGRSMGLPSKRCQIARKYLDFQCNAR
jgi:RNA recognition motif-containing protein